MLTRLAPGGATLAPGGVALAVSATYPPATQAQLDVAPHYVASTLAAADGAELTTWPNTGTAGSQYDLLARGPASARPTMQRGAGPNGRDCVRVPAAGWLATAAAGPLAGTQARFLLAVVRLSTLKNQDILMMGSAQNGQGCGVYEYENSGGGSWSVYGYGNTVHAIVPGDFVALAWRAQVEGSTFSIYTGANETVDPQSPPTSFVNTDAGAPLTIGTGIVFGLADLLDVADVIVDTTFPTGLRWQQLKNYVADTYGLTL